MPWLQKKNMGWYVNNIYTFDISSMCQWLYVHNKFNQLGCGQHKESVMSKIPADQQCKCREQAANNNANNNNDKNKNKDGSKDSNNNNNNQQNQQVASK